MPQQKPSHEVKGIVRRAPRQDCFEAQSSSVEMGEPSRRKTISAAFHQSGLYGRVARRKPLLSKRHLTALFEFDKMHLKDSQTMRNTILWSDESKIELFGLNAKPEGNLWECFSAAGTGSLVRIEGKMNGRHTRPLIISLDLGLYARSHPVGSK